jgi:G:T-mismatch repair DNA endonuclease (very short patch repair protein)
MSIAGRGKKRSEETRRRMSESRKGWIYAESTLRKMSNAKIGKKLSDEHRRKLSEARRGEKHPFYGKHLSAIHKNNIRKAKIGTKYTEEQKRKLSELWKKRVKEGRMPRKILKIPNSKEIVLLDIIKELGLPYKFVGDHSFWIGGKNPDFLNVNGKKKVIELFGDYWHNLDGRMSEKERKKHFKKYGFDCLVIWEKELKDMEQVKNKIRDFDSPWLECP